MKDLLTPVVPLLGVALGWVLNELSARSRWKRDWATRLSELRIESYAEWTAGMEEALANYARQKSGSQYTIVRRPAVLPSDAFQRYCLGCK